MAFLSSVSRIPWSLVLLFAVTFHFKSGNSENELQILQDPNDFDDFQRKFYGLRCLVMGPDIITYDWYHNGTLIDDNYVLTYRGFHSNHLIVDTTIPDQRYQGTYQVFISSSFGKIFGTKVRVKFKVFGAFTYQGKSETREVVVGQPYGLRCPKHSYTTDCLYKWGSRSPATGLRHIKQTQNRVVLKDGTLFFSSIQEKDIKDFDNSSTGSSCILECTWCNGAKISHGIVLEPKLGDMKPFGPKIITKLEDREVLLGTDFVIFICAAAGSPTPSYRWVKINTDGVNKDAIILEKKHTELSSFNHTLTFHNISQTHNGTYGCVVSSNGKEEQIDVKVIVREKPRWSSDGIISSHSLDVFTNFTWECKAHGDPLPNYTWYANATKLSTKKGRYEIDGGKLAFSRLLVEDEGMYECVAENGFGYIYQTAALFVRAKRPQFNKTNINAVLLLRGEGVLHCQSDAIPQASYTWAKDNEAIDFSKSEKYNIRGGHHLVIKKITTDDAGIYKCTATNEFGTNNQTTNVTIDDISFVITPESMENIVEWTAFSLYCKATSFFKVKYKWRFDNQELVYDNRKLWSLKANRLLIQNANETDSGRYECVAYIDDPARVESIRSAYVTVEGPPRALKGFQLLENCTNSSATLTWEPLEIYNYSSTFVVIEWRTTYDPPQKWHRSNVKVNATIGKTEVANLTSWAKIQFRATPLNMFAFGEPTKSTQFKYCETPPGAPVKCPENVHGIAGAPGVLEIRWNRMLPVDFKGPGFNYTLKYRRFDESVWNDVVLARTENSFTISNAGFNKLWYFKIQAFNSEGPGPICLENSSYSGQSKPGAITQLTAKEITATSAILTWSAMPDNENIDGFKLEYWQIEERVPRNKRVVHTNGCGDVKNPCRANLERESREYSVLGLVPLSHHTVSLRAYNKAGDGPSKYLTFTTTALSSAKLTAPTYRRSWFITVVSFACFLMLIVLILFLLRKRSERYPVRKREREKGGLENLDDFNDPFQNLDIDGLSNPSIDDYEERDMDEDENSVFYTEDKYDDGGSFIGEYGDVKPSAKKYEERFV